MNTLKTLSLLAVCVVAGVALFTLKGVGDAGQNPLITLKAINKLTGVPKVLHVSNVAAGSKLAINVQQETETAVWKIQGFSNLSDCQASYSQEQSGWKGGKTVIECTVGDLIGSASISLEKWTYNPDQKALKVFEGDKLKLTFDVGQPLVIHMAR